MNGYKNNLTNDNYTINIIIKTKGKKMNIKQLIKDNNFLYYPQNDEYRSIVSLDKNDLNFCSVGGGFVKRIDINNQDFIENIKKGNIQFVNKIPTNFTKIKLFHDHWNGQYIYGYVNLKNRWNGWFCPLVELSQIKRFNTIQKNNDSNLSTDLFKIINDNQISIIDFNDEEEIIINSEDLIINGKVKKVFDISLGWTWSGDEI